MPINLWHRIFDIKNNKPDNMNLLLLLLLIRETSINLTSTAFVNNGDIPSKYTCQGQGVNPPLSIGDIPMGTASLILIVEDPEATKGTFDHWVVFNIPPMTTTIEENSKPGIEGKNGSGEAAYKGPCPPTGKHHYYFKLYALDIKLKLKSGATKNEVLDSMTGHILGTGELVGLYQKK
jgi:Raf kinase inhibitor-like YbhB/YbcL family protein